MCITMTKKIDINASMIKVMIVLDRFIQDNFMLAFDSVPWPFVIELQDSATMIRSLMFIVFNVWMMIWIGLSSSLESIG
ncbi:hypothetical protein ACJX0J_033740, partial [Zea mays]